MSAETLFYVAGGVLVAAALLLSAWGLRHEETFPNKAALRVGTVLFLALVAVVATFAVVNARDEQEKRNEELAAEDAEGAEAAETIRFSVPSGTELVYDQKSVDAKAGQAKIELDNMSEVAHDVSIEQGGNELGKTDIISASIASTVLDLKPGEYVFFCSVPGHREAGMEGDLTVK